MYNAVVCAIAKHENAYIAEWVEYYLTMGFDHIYLFDNNESTYPDVKEAIPEKYKKQVTIINIQDCWYDHIQSTCYKFFYEIYSNNFNWVAFFDIDEFLNLNGECDNNINKFLAQDKFKDFNQIRIKWQLFGDDGLLERDMSIPVHEFFKKPIFKLGFSNNTKIIIRGHMPEKLKAHCIHYVINETGNLWKTCLPSGRPIKDVSYAVRAGYDLEKVYLNHYITKTLKEFINIKMTRGDIWSPEINFSLDYYKKINKLTTEQEQFLATIPYNK